MKKEENQPNYFAIIPADVRYSENLKPNAKLLYGEITALTNREGFCWATNKYFSELYGVSETSISLWIKNLKEENFIDTYVSENYLRKIYIKKPLRKVKGGIKKSYNPPLRKVKDNSTINNTINNNTEGVKKEKEKVIIIPEKITKHYFIWLEDRKERNLKKLTERGMKLQWKMLEKYNLKDQEQIINNSIEKSWTGLFDLRNNNFQKKTPELLNNIKDYETGGEF